MVCISERNDDSGKASHTKVIHYWKKNSRDVVKFIVTCMGLRPNLLLSTVQYTVPVTGGEVQMIAIAEICEKKPRVAPSLDTGKRQTSLVK
jgi:hypothetical protein